MYDFTDHRSHEILYVLIYILHPKQHYTLLLLYTYTLNSSMVSDDNMVLILTLKGLASRKHHPLTLTVLQHQASSAQSPARSLYFPSV